MLIGEIASFLDRLSSHDLVPILAIGGGLLIAALSIVVCAWRRVRETAALAELKRDLIAQGRPTEEIERICNAGLKKDN